jgi:hypothetical protein
MRRTAARLPLRHGAHLRDRRHGDTDLPRRASATPARQTRRRTSREPMTQKCRLRRNRRRPDPRTSVRYRMPFLVPTCLRSWLPALAMVTSGCPGFRSGSTVMDAAPTEADASTPALPLDAGATDSSQMSARQEGGTDAPTDTAPPNSTAMCAVGERRCGADQRPENCGTGGQWTPVAEACRFICAGRGECIGTCRPGSKQCAGSDGRVPQLCDQNGQWMSLAACQNLCSSGSCSGSCTPGTRRCGPNDTPESCSPMGTWEPGVPCGNFACVTSSCSASQCRTGYKRCGADCIPMATCCPAQGCCAAEACVNNCGDRGMRPCSNGQLGGCSATDRTCCPGMTMPCNNRCNQTGSRACVNGTWGACSVTDATCCTPMAEVCNGRDDDCDNEIDECPSGESCIGGKCEKPCGVRGAPCCTGEGRRCSSTADFCCNSSSWCSSSELNRCQARRPAGEFCDYLPPQDGDWCNADNWCSGDTDRCTPNVGEGEVCGSGPGFPKCQTGLYCDLMDLCRRF